jgi:hypothetical protein
MFNQKISFLKKEKIMKKLFLQIILIIGLFLIDHSEGLKVVLKK